MEFKGRLSDVAREWGTGRLKVTFDVLEMESGVFELAENGIKDVDLRVKAEKYRKKRSLDANAYCWVLLQKLAEAVHSDKDSVYLECLKKYSPAFTHIIVKEDAINAIKAMYRTSIDLGEVKPGWRQLQVYFGSSTFDSKEMSVFIDGIISECKELGIETLSPKVIERMKQLWKAH